MANLASYFAADLLLSRRKANGALQSGWIWEVMGAAKLLSLMLDMEKSTADLLYESKFKLDLTGLLEECRAKHSECTTTAWVLHLSDLEKDMIGYPTELPADTSATESLFGDPIFRKV